MLFLHLILYDLGQDSFFGILFCNAPQQIICGPRAAGGQVGTGKCGFLLPCCAIEGDRHNVSFPHIPALGLTPWPGC
jgi:hypothetical protein